MGLSAGGFGEFQGMFPWERRGVCFRGGVLFLEGGGGGKVGRGLEAFFRRMYKSEGNRTKAPALEKEFRDDPLQS